MILQLFIVLVLLALNCNLVPVYITNSADNIIESYCTVEGQMKSPCITLQMLAAGDFPKNESLSIYFINVHYSVHENSSITLGSLTSVSLKPWNEERIVKILCMGRFSIEVTSTHEFLMQFIIFTNCGRQSHLLQVDRCSKNTFIFISQVDFFQTEGCSLVLYCAAPVVLKVHKSTFESGGGSNLNYSIYIHSSQLNFILSETSFINNSAGSVYFNSNSNGGLKIDSCLFVNNTGTTNGSVIYLNNSAGVIINQSSFINNFNTAITLVQSTEQASLLVFNSKFTSNKGFLGGVFCVLHSFRIIINNSNFTNNQARKGGVIFGATESKNWITILIFINSCTFVGNKALNGSGGVLHIQTARVLSVFLNDTSCMKNEADSGGVAFVVNIRTFKLEMAEMEISENKAVLGGGVIYAAYVKDLQLERGVFINNSATFGGALFVQMVDTVSMINCNFLYNYAFQLGGALNINIIHDKMKYTTVKLSECSFGYNQAKMGGGGVFMQRTKLNASSCRYFGHHVSVVGGAIALQESALFLNNCHSYNNSAIVSGGSIAARNSFINFTGNSSFDRDTAIEGLGGAIYIEDTITDCETDCLISWDKKSTINFINTYARRGGSMIYGGMMDRCNKIQNENSLSSLSFNNMPYNVLSHGITSRPLQICQCENSIINCHLRSGNRAVTPGTTFYIEVTCLDQMKQAVSCIVRGEYQNENVHLGQGQSLRYINGCNVLSFSAYSNDARTSGLKLTGGMCSREHLKDTEGVLNFNVVINLCPTGFEIVNSECQCDQRLKTLFKTVLKCDVESETIVIDQGWISYGDHYLKASIVCPLSYCIPENKSISLQNADKQCNHHRSGVLCGQCISNYSAILGSWQCSDCSKQSRYNFIWLVVSIALAGVALIVFLFITKMTVSSGTLNGLVFYANVISFSGLLDGQSNSIHPIFRTILSWINLDFGIQVCFYHGMDVYQKTWLQFIFPFYIWLLVIVIIIFCHFSPKVMKLMGMRNIEILATLFLLSYTKLLKTISAVFSAISISVADSKNTSDPLTAQKVWVYDGNIDYLSGKHLPLFIAALLILLFVFLPFTLLLVFGQYLIYLPNRKGLKWIHSTVVFSILDAYHAPYTRYHRYWTGLGLLVRCGLFTIFSTSYDIHKNLFWINLSLISLLCYRQMFCSKIYHNKFCDILELYYLMNAAALSAALLYSDNNYAFTVSIVLALIGFFVIVIYHVSLIVKETRISRKIMQYLLIFFTKIKPRSSTAVEEDVAAINPSNSSTFVELRETLLEN